MEKGFYHIDRGYWQTLSNPSTDILEGYPEGTIEVPTQPSALHTFNGTEWVPPTQESIDAEQAEIIRNQRNLELFQEVDLIAGNALRWAALSPTDKEAWAVYRQALLDVTDQVGFPHNVAWPSKPT